MNRPPRPTNLPAIGVKISDGQVSTFGFSSRPLGQLAGAHAEISDSTRHRRVAGSLAATAITAPIAGPLALVGLLSKKSKAFAFVTFADGTLHEKKLDGKSAIRAAQQAVARFNALAAAAAPKP